MIIDFGNYAVTVDFNDYQNAIKQCLSNMDKNSLMDLVWDSLEHRELIELFIEELRDIYPPPDDYDVDKEIADYYDKVRM